MLSRAGRRLGTSFGRERARLQNLRIGENSLASASQFDLIVSTIAVLFEPSDTRQPTGITSEQLSAVIRKPLSIGQTPDGGTIISSNRDQIEIQLFPNKIDVRESSGDPQQGGRKIPRVLHEFMAIVHDAPIRSYGMNFILDVYTRDPSAWLSVNLLNQELASTLGSPVSSNVVSLIFDRPPKTLTVRFESREPDRINVNFNATEHADTLPPQEQLEVELTDLYESLQGILVKLEAQYGS